MFTGIFYQFDNLRYRALTKGLGGTQGDDTTQVDAARDDLVALVDLKRYALACQGHCVQTGSTADDGTIQGNFLTWTHLDNGAHGHLLRTDSIFRTRYTCYVGTDIHQVRDACATLSLGIALEELTYLKEQHHEDGLWKFRLGARHETDAEGTDGSYRHQEMLIERVAMCQSLCSFLQCAGSY